MSYLVSCQTCGKNCVVEFHQENFCSPSCAQVYEDRMNEMEQAQPQKASKKPLSGIEKLLGLVFLAIVVIGLLAMTGSLDDVMRALSGSTMRPAIDSKWDGW